MGCFRYFLAIAFLLGSEAYAAVDRPCAKILDYVEKNLKLSGTLKQDKQGFVYVDVDNDYICKLTGLIEDPGFVQPDYFQGEYRYGAHVSVIYAAEAARYKMGKLEEAGRTVHFHVCRCEIVATERDPAIDSYYFLIIESPELSEIRRKYGLPQPKYPFHITIGVKYADLEYQDAPQALDE